MHSFTILSSNWWYSRDTEKIYTRKERKRILYVRKHDKYFSVDAENHITQHTEEKKPSPTKGIIYENDEEENVTKDKEIH